MTTQPLSPGDYLRKRREAAQLSRADVAAVFHTVPRWSEIERVDWLERVEANIEPLTVRTASMLRCIFTFDVEVLGDLALIAQGVAVAPPRLCRECACSEHCACHEGADSCAWVALDLCSACAPADPDDPDDGERVGVGIDPDDRGDGEPARTPANDDLAPELAA